MEFPGTDGWQVGIWFCDEDGNPNTNREPTQADQEEALDAIGGKIDEFYEEDGVTLATLPEEMAHEAWYGGHTSRTVHISSGRVTVEVEMP